MTDTVDSSSARFPEPEKDTKVETDDVVSAEDRAIAIDEEMRKALSKMLFWLAQGKFSHMPVPTIQDMMRDRDSAKAILDALEMGDGDDYVFGATP